MDETCPGLLLRERHLITIWILDLKELYAGAWTV
jgi:hypothetical protein